MANSSSSTPNLPSPPPYDPNLPTTTNTTFVQADPTTFRAVVQHLTGAPHPPKLPLLTHPARLAGKSPSGHPPFKLHERRKRKLEIQLSRGGCPLGSMVSPVSTLDGFGFGRGGSPRTPRSPAVEEEAEAEERAIAEKGFYLHRSPMGTPRGGSEPELLPLFPLHSPRD